MNRLYYLQTRKNHGTLYISYRLKEQYHGIQTEASDPKHGLERAISIIKELGLKSNFDKEVEVYKRTYLDE